MSYGKLEFGRTRCTVNKQSNNGDCGVVEKNSGRRISVVKSKMRFSVRNLSTKNGRLNGYPLNSVHRFHTHER